MQTCIRCTASFKHLWRWSWLKIKSLLTQWKPGLSNWQYSKVPGKCLKRAIFEEREKMCLELYKPGWSCPGLEFLTFRRAQMFIWECPSHWWTALWSTYNFVGVNFARRDSMAQQAIWQLEPNHIVGIQCCTCIYIRRFSSSWAACRLLQLRAFIFTYPSV